MRDSMLARIHRVAQNPIDFTPMHEGARRRGSGPSRIESGTIDDDSAGPACEVNSARSGPTVTTATGLAHRRWPAALTESPGLDCSVSFMKTMDYTLTVGVRASAGR
jgi:hypothetical protein